jgi:trk system potassium uptake protein TrkH
MTVVTRAPVAGRRRPSDPGRSPWRRLSDAIDDIGRKSPARFAILIFTGLIVVFTLLFSLPISSADRTITPLADSVFTAVSVICVTGLATVDMATHWSLFGHVVIFVGVQIGAIGVLTLASIMGLVVSRCGSARSVAC